MNTILLSSALCLAAFPQSADDGGDDVRIGHSAHGDAFDEGPRQRPWKMEDIGSTHFPITTSVPEVQEWFDQGNTLLHSFWYFEAERSFRWCLKLDPECAMAWWGLARSTGRGGGSDRMQDFLREAVLRKDTVTERERMYIEAWEEAYLPAMSGAIETLDEEGRQSFEKLAEKLEELVIAYPDDVEARALFMLYSLYDSSRYGQELIAREIFAEEPLHPGAHHYRIHNWDGPDGAQALDSCEAYGALAKYIGHSNHMPGHIYSGIGMWHEGAIWMDRATRVEKHYMRERLIFPFNHWNHAHNRNYLSFIQEQLGMAEAAIDGGRQLISAPLDPKYNDPDERGVFEQGKTALVRGLVKFERWDEILEEGNIPWRESAADDLWRIYAESLAHLELGDRRAAIDGLIELKQLEERLEEDGNPRLKTRHEILLAELHGLVALGGDDELEGIRLLQEAADRHLELYERANDPPSSPRVPSNVLGEAYLERGSPRLAARAFERTLEKVRNDAFALAGLAQAHHALGELDAAKGYAGRFLHVWSDADPGLRWSEAVAALGLDASPIDLSARAQRNYASQDLEPMGPGTWRPYAAPELDALDADENRVTLDEYLGRNVLLVFFLGEECPHCVEQLVAIDERIADFSSRDVDVLGISGDTPEMNRASLAMGELGFRLLSDAGFENAKRFHSYDEFEDFELHSTIFIDRSGKVRWARSGGDPFTELDFLLEEIDRVNTVQAAVGAVEAGAPASQGQ